MASKDHSGQCAFCGTAVGLDFKICTGCGAEWKRMEGFWDLFAGWGLILCVTILGIPLGLCLLLLAWLLRKFVETKTRDIWKWVRISG